MTTSEPNPDVPDRETRNTPILYQPLSLLFFATVLGILIDRLCAPGTIFWIVTVPVMLSVGFWTHRTRKPILSTLCILSACAALFGLWHDDRWNRFAENELGFHAEELGSPIALRGRVREMPRVLPRPTEDPGRVFEVSERTIFTLRAEQLRDGADWIDVSGNVSVVVEGNRDDLRIGDSIQIFGSLSKPVGPQNPGDFNYAEMLRSKRILSIVRASSPEAVSILQNGRLGIGRFLESLRRGARERLLRFMDEKTAPYALAMLLGMREGVDEETTQTLIETGTMHILAISGLHIGLVAATLAFLLRCFGVSRQKTAIVLILSVLAYLFLTDVRPPAIRATVLVCVMATALYTGRRSYGVNTLCATALIVLAGNPTELFQFGAQLSFLATGAFFWVPSPEFAGRPFRRLFRFFRRREKDPEKFRLHIEANEWAHWSVVSGTFRILYATAQLFLVSLTIWTVALPLILERIHVLSPIALLVNPLLWFPLTAALLCGFGTMIFGFIPFLGTMFGFLADCSFGVLFGMIGFFQRLGGHYWVPGPPFWWNVVFYSVFAFFTFLPVRRPKARILAVLLAVWVGVGFGVGILRDLDRRWNERLTISVFSVGHGNCVLITTPEKKTIVYDVGCISSPKRGADTLSRGLWRLGKTRIDAIVLSHADSDHYNGVVHLTDRFHIGTVFVSPYMFVQDDAGLKLLRETLAKHRIPLVEIGDGDDLTGYGLPDSRFFHPPKTDFGETDSANAASLVLRFEHFGVGVLLPGDLDGRLTAPFLEREPIPTDIVMIPHHGGRSSQTETLLAWASPKRLLVSAGRFTYRSETMENYRKRGFTVRNTFEEGYIEISIGKKRPGTVP